MIDQIRPTDNIQTILFVKKSNLHKYKIMDVEVLIEECKWIFVTDTVNPFSFMTVCLDVCLTHNLSVPDY